MTLFSRREKGSKVNFRSLLLFYFIAISVSGLLAMDATLEQFQSLMAGTLASGWTFLPAGVGTLLAAIWVFKYDKSLFRTIDLKGNNFGKNLLLTAIPVVVFTILGLENKHGYNPHVYGLIFSVVSVAYAVCEEMFWRGYMLDGLRGLNKWLYPLLIGIVWWAWHLRFSSAFDYTWFLGVCLSGSYLLCYTTNLTKSYMTAGAFHAVLVITTTSSRFTDEKLYGILLSVVIWILIGFSWKTRETDRAESDIL